MSVATELYAHCRAAWPEIALAGGEEVFAQHLARHLAPGAEPATLCIEDLYLACACAQGSAAALLAFERLHLSQLDHFLSPRDRDPTFIGELRQTLRDKLFVSRAGQPPKIADYSGRGSLHSWLRVVTVHTSRNLHRGRRNDPLHEANEAAVQALASGPDPELSYLKGRYRMEFQEAVRAALQALPSEQQDVIRLHYAEGLNLERIGQRLGVSRATVARWRTAAQQAILDDTRRQLRQRLRLSDSEFGSLARLVRSQLEVSLSHLSRPDKDRAGK